MKRKMDLSLSPLLFLLTLSFSLSLFSQTSNSTTLEVFHSPFEPTKWDEMLTGDEARFRYLVSLVAGKSIVPLAASRPNYVVRAKIGNPPQTLLLAIDNSNDAAWIPCTGCSGCPTSSAAFSPVKSTSFRNLSCAAPQCRMMPKTTCQGGACGFNMTYGGSTIAGNMSSDTLTLSSDPILRYTFGCVRRATGTSMPPQGLLGLGRGPLSLLAQTQTLYQSTFSYCLPSFKSQNFAGSLRLGPTGQPPRIKFTPLMKNPRRSSLYYVDLVGIKVGRRVVDVPKSALAFNPVTGAGTVIDSGTVFTRLVEPVYTAVRNEFRRRMGPKTPVTSLGGFDTCYTIPVTTQVPTITFMFQGLNLTLPQDNFLIHSTAGSTTCLAMAAAPAGDVNSVLNVIAATQQQNHRVLFDVPNSRVGFAREVCSS